MRKSRELPRGVRVAVKRTADRAAERSDLDEPAHLVAPSPPPLQAASARRQAAEPRRVVTSGGGWDSFQTIEPYLY